MRQRITLGSLAVACAVVLGVPATGMARENEGCHSENASFISYFNTVYGGPSEGQEPFGQIQSDFVHSVNGPGSNPGTFTKPAAQTKIREVGDC